MFRRIIYLLLVVLFTTTPLFAEAQNRSADEQRRRLEQYKRELDKAKREVDDLKREKSSASREVAALDREMRLHNDYIAEVESERKAIAYEVAIAEALLDSLDGVLAHNREVYAEAVRVAYRNYRKNNSTNYILSAESLGDVARRMAEMEHITTSRQALADTIARQSEVINAQHAALELRSHELDSITAVLEAERRDLSNTRTKAQQAYNQLTKREREAINEQRRQQKLHDEAVAELQRLLKGNKVGAGFSRNTKGLNLPVEGGTLSQEGFGATISGKKGDAVRTIHEGIVQEIQYKESTRRYTIFLGYNEYLVTYTNLSSVCVKKGDIVKKDQKIGTIGNGINSNDPPFVRLAIYDCETKQPLYVSDFFKKI